MTSIEVRISPALIGLVPSEVYVGNLYLLKLREAHIPVTGDIFPTGVSRGSLTQRNCPMTGARIFLWSPE